MKRTIEIVTLACMVSVSSDPRLGHDLSTFQDSMGGFSSTYTEEAGSGIMDWATIDFDTVPAVDNRRVVPNWDWLIRRIPYQASENPLERVFYDLQRENSGAVQFRFTDDLGVTIYPWTPVPNPPAASWSTTFTWPDVVTYGAGRNWAAGTKTDTWEGWRGSLPTSNTGPAVPPFSVGTSQTWRDFLVLQASHPEIIWPKFYQVVNWAEIRATRVTGQTEYWRPNTPPSGSRLPRLDGPDEVEFNPLNCYLGQFVVLGPAMPGSPTEDRIVCGVCYDNPGCRFVPPGSNVFPGGMLLPAGDTTTFQYSLFMFITVANNGRVPLPPPFPGGPQVLTSHIGYCYPWMGSITATVAPAGSEMAVFNTYLIPIPNNGNLGILKSEIPPPTNEWVQSLFSAITNGTLDMPNEPAHREHMGPYPQ